MRSAAFLRVVLVLGLSGGGAAFAACSDHVPASLDDGDAAAATPTFGIDVRPVSTTCKGVALPASQARISFERVSPVKFENPTGIVEHDGKLYVLEQGQSAAGGTINARVRVLGADTSQAPVVVDISPRVWPGGEAGLLGLAFHPRFAQNTFVFLYYLSPHPQNPPPPNVVFQSVVARYESPDGGLTLDPASEKRILVVDQPFSNHNGGTIAFGNDGFLYLGLGDGGSGGDPLNNSQNKDKLLGKILRIDVDGGDPYAIPPSNPYAVSGGRPEIYALGLRNPFRFSFDRPTGDLWVGDVGQAAREEVDRVVLGGNYGWNIREGFNCYQPMVGCQSVGLIDPIVDHDHGESVSIVGGVIYRGTKVPELTGKYVYGDNGLSSFFAFDPREAKPVPIRLDKGLPPALHPAQFALDPQGELVFVDYVSGGVFRIAPPATPPYPPTKLSEIGCFDTKQPARPGAGLFPYDVNVPQWSDGQVAERFLAIPGSATILVKDDGHLELPPGSVALRTLRRKNVLAETQVLARRPDGTWSAATYAWNGDGKDATLTTDAGCFGCHNDEAGVTLGLEAGQLTKVFPYPVQPATALASLEHLGMLSKPVAAGAYPAFAPLDGYDPIASRARAYLQTNCASCHRGGAAPLPDLRFGATAQNLCGLVKAMRATDKTRMPPLASAIPDTAAIAVVESWVRSLGCP